MSMGKKLYVGNLPFSVTDQVLQETFSQVGKVESARVITDRDTGRSKGFGFVEIADKTQAESAINALNGKVLGGRPLTVNEAKPREERPRGDFARSGGRNQRRW